MANLDVEKLKKIYDSLRLSHLNGLHQAMISSATMDVINKNILITTGKIAATDELYSIIETHLKEI